MFIYICCRILELKNEMVLLEYSEYHYFDDVLSDLKLTPVSNTTSCVLIFKTLARIFKVLQIFVG